MQRLDSYPCLLHQNSTKIRWWFKYTFMFENHCFTWSVTPSFGLYLLNQYHCKSLWTDLPVTIVSHFINVFKQLPSACWRHNSCGTGSALPISQSLSVAFQIKSWLTHSFLARSLTTILDAFLNISMKCGIGLGRNGVATVNWKTREIWRMWWLSWDKLFWRMWWLSDKSLLC